MMIHLYKPVRVLKLCQNLLHRRIPGNKRGIVQMYNPSILTELENQILLILPNILNHKPSIFHLQLLLVKMRFYETQAVLYHNV